MKSVRKTKHLTQLDLAHRLNVSKGTVSGYEQGISYPSLDTFTQICNILEVSADYLLGISDSLPFKMGGLTNEQMESVLQFISTIQNANAIIEEQRKSRQKPADKGY